VGGLGFALTTSVVLTQHTVLPTDTMAGLKIRYKVTAAELRKYNNFFGERFQLLTTLRIPVAGREDVIAKNMQVSVGM